MNVLVIGRGGREHSIINKLRESNKIDNIFVAPGNGGMEQDATRVPIQETNITDLISFAKANDISWTIVGPENPLMLGIVDEFKAEGLNVFGPSKKAALIEGSKSFAKDLMKKYTIPTASYETFEDASLAKLYVEEHGTPIVIKADGLAAGKGVVIAHTTSEAIDAIDQMMSEKQFGEAGSQIVIEEFLEGEEFSLMAFVNGETVYPMIPAQDHKRAFDGDAGPNTGGMGAYAPVPQISKSVISEAVDSILYPTAQALEAEGRSFNGILYAGLILTKQGPKVIEFNARFGDPETQVILPLLETDLIDVISSLDQQKPLTLEWKDRYCFGVVLASKGYPGEYQKGKAIKGLIDGEHFYIHAGTEKKADTFYSNGGRVMLVGAQHNDFEQARQVVYHAMNAIDSSDFFYRKDIGHLALRASAFSNESKKQSYNTTNHNS